MRFEIMRLDNTGGTSPALAGTGAGAAVDSTVVDADSVGVIVQQAAAAGQRLYIRPAEAPATAS